MWAWGSGDSKGKLRFPYQIACQPFGKAWQAATSVLPQPDLQSPYGWHPLSTMIRMASGQRHLGLQSKYQGLIPFT